MTKIELVLKITENTGMNKGDVLTVVENFMDEVKNSLSQDENVYLRGFGSFIVKTRAEKTGRNISKKTSVVIPAHNVPAFKPAKIFVDRIKSEVKIK